LLRILAGYRDNFGICNNNAIFKASNLALGRFGKYGKNNNQKAG
jgi:hypothetical protein